MALTLDDLRRAFERKVEKPIDYAVALHGLVQVSVVWPDLAELPPMPLSFSDRCDQELKARMGDPEVELVPRRYTFCEVTWTRCDEHGKELVKSRVKTFMHQSTDGPLPKWANLLEVDA